MKKWNIAGVLVCLLLVATVVLMGVFFFEELSGAFNGQTEESTGWTEVSTEASTEATTEATTEPTVEASTEPAVEETTEPTVEETTEPTTEPTQPPTTEPTQPPTTEPTQPPTTVPPTTVPPTTAPTTQPTTAPTEPQDQTGLYGKHAFVFDTSIGEYLYAKGNTAEALAPASLTKLYSAWVALQYLDPATVVTAGDEVKWIDPASSRAWIYKGQSVKVETLVEGMMLPSGNDAAYILAVAAGKAILGDPNADPRAAFDRFVAEMNNKAASAGLLGSHFANPDGFDAEGHYMTMEDLLTVSELALDNSVIRKYAKTQKDSGLLVSGQSYNWRNSNQLLNPESKYYIPAACGLKTGSTKDAGNCLLSAFPKDGGYLIIGVLGCAKDTQRYEDTLKLYGMFG